MPTEAADPLAARHAARRAWLRLEWMLLFVAIVAAAFMLGNGALSVTDRVVYDRLIGSLQRPAPAQVVIVAIDDRSLAGIGRWPWKRSVHAQLLNVLANGAPRAVGLDLLLTETDSASADQALAAAMARNGRVVLPILTTQDEGGTSARRPIAPLAAAAAALAHIRLDIDGDGRVRSVAPVQQLGRVQWPAFAVALQRLAVPDAAVIDSQRLQIPYFGPAGHFQQVSYIDVLHGTVPASMFRDKIVLVGAVAAGMGDLLPVPQGFRHGLMSGVEIHANIVGALLEGRSIRTVSATWKVLFSALPALLVLCGFTLLSPRWTLALTGMLTLVMALLCMLLLRHDIWLPPSAALLLLWLVYPLWSWRRLESALRYLDEETRRLAASVPLSLRPPASRRRWEFLERRIEAARGATRRMLALHQFVSDNLDSMPDANLVIDRQGLLVLHNRQAGSLFASLGMTPERGQSIASLLQAIDDGVRPPHWLEQPQLTPIELGDRLGRIFSVRSTQAQDGRGSVIGAIVSLADITALRAAQRQRDDSLNFISHDIRAPQSSILAMLDLHRRGQVVLDDQTLFSRIERSVRSTLALADDFVLLARAQSGQQHHHELDFDAVLVDAIDDLWSLARARGASIDIDSDRAPHWVSGERQLLVRALGNLLSNAIKYGPQGQRIACHVRREDGQLVCCIDDQGPGLPADDPNQVFAAFYRSAQDEHGAGLGLHFVRTVVQAHGGRITAENLPAGGARFVLRLPCTPEQEQEQEEQPSSQR